MGGEGSKGVIGVSLLCFKDIYTGHLHQKANCSLISLGLDAD